MYNDFVFKFLSIAFTLMDNICIFIFRVCDNFVILINIYLLDLLKLVRQKSMVHYGFLLQNLHCYKCQGLRGSVFKFF